MSRKGKGCGSRNKRGKVGQSPKYRENLRRELERSDNTKREENCKYNTVEDIRKGVNSYG